MTILDQIVAYKRDEELPKRMVEVSIDEIQKRAAAMPAPLNLIKALRVKAGVALIAEIKRASPSKGLLAPDFDPLRLASIYAENGAAAISLLTDEKFFMGSLGFLTMVRKKIKYMPLLRKDFIIHPFQVYEARAHAADAILLIAAILSNNTLAELLELSNSMGMDALVEIHNEEELKRVLPLSPRLIGVNNRNLSDFSVDIDTCLSLRRMVPDEICFVAESGIHTAADVRRLANAGVDAMLIGEALVTALDVSAKIKELIGES